jgi:hypothetical protein
VFREVPDVSHLMPFYAPGVYHLTKKERKGRAWAFKAEPCRMLGYSEDGKHSYHVLNVRTGKVVRDRSDCVFDESFYEVLREHQKNPDSHMIHELFDLFPPSSESGQTEEAQVCDCEVGEFSVSFSGDPDSAAVTDSCWEGLFPGVPNGDFASDFDCEDQVDSLEDLRQMWLASTASAALDIPALPTAPATVEEALAGPDREVWCAAILKELAVMEKLGVMERAQQQHGHGMKMKMILRTAYNNDFTVKYKARLVICGYSQVYGRDYDETYSPTVAVLVILMVIHVAAFL